MINFASISTTVGENFGAFLFRRTSKKIFVSNFVFHAPQGFMINRLLFKNILAKCTVQLPKMTSTSPVTPRGPLWTTLNGQEAIQNGLAFIGSIIQVVNLQVVNLQVVNYR